MQLCSCEVPEFEHTDWFRLISGGALPDLSLSRHKFPVAIPVSRTQSLAFPVLHGTHSFKK
jgi:hypothetical protein